MFASWGDCWEAFERILSWIQDQGRFSNNFAKIGKYGTETIWKSFQQKPLDQNLRCRWSVKLASESFMYKILITGIDFGSCGEEVSKLSGKI